jgi:hypothetical protein
MTVAAERLVVVAVAVAMAVAVAVMVKYQFLQWLGFIFVLKTLAYCLVWAEPKTIATSNILHLWKLIKYCFTVKPLHFYYINRKPLIRAFQRYLG